MQKKILSALLLLCACGVNAQNPTHIYKVWGSQITAGANMTAAGDSDGQAKFEIEERREVPFTQLCVSQTKPAALSTKPVKPYYNVRMALPIPSCYTPTEQGEKVGIDWGVYHHLHSAGMDIMPNGDILAVYFSTPLGKAEADTATTFVQCRRRYGSDEWDMPELLFKTRGANDQSALLFTDKDTVWLFAGGRGMTDYVPFRILKSTDNGAHWTMTVPVMDKKLERYTAQPVSNAFRSSNGDLYVVIDGKGAQSLLLRSQDGGIHWHDMGGRTSTRHSTIVPLNEDGTLLAQGGKNGNLNGWNPQNISLDWGATWQPATESPFPPAGTAQRPSMIRLASGALCYVGDSYQHKRKIAPAKGWQHGNECFVAISRNNGHTWKIKTLPVTLPQHHRLDHPSLGYCTVRQGQDGLIHVLTTTNYPGLEIEFNEEWIDSDIPTALGENGSVYGQQKALTPLKESGYYVLNGTITENYPDGKPMHTVTYKDGRRTGIETLWREDGTKRWEWTRFANNRAQWVHYRPNGMIRIISRWKTQAVPRDLNEVTLNGAIADMYTWEYDKVGMQVEAYRFHDGVLDGSSKQGINSAIINEGK